MKPCSPRAAPGTDGSSSSSSSSNNNNHSSSTPVFVASNPGALRTDPLPRLLYKCRPRWSAPYALLVCLLYLLAASLPALLLLHLLRVPLLSLGVPLAASLAVSGALALLAVCLLLLRAPREYHLFSDGIWVRTVGRAVHHLTVHEEAEGLASHPAPSAGAGGGLRFEDLLDARMFHLSNAGARASDLQDLLLGPGATGSGWVRRWCSILFRVHPSTATHMDSRTMVVLTFRQSVPCSFGCCSVAADYIFTPPRLREFLRAVETGLSWVLTRKTIRSIVQGEDPAVHSRKDSRLLVVLEKVRSLWDNVGLVPNAPFSQLMDLHVDLVLQEELYALAGLRHYYSSMQAHFQLPAEDRMHRLRDLQKSLQEQGRSTTLTYWCSQCSCYVDDDQNHSQACQYHPGEFRQLISAVKMARGWTCCGVMDREEPGCVFACHSVDPETGILQTTDDTPSQERLLQQWMSVEATSRRPAASASDGEAEGAESSSPQRGESEGELPCAEDEGLLSWDPRFMSTTSLSSCASSTDPAALEPRTKVIMHKVSEHDTLPGLAIRYDVKESEILRENRMLNGMQIQQVMYLRIPRQARDAEAVDVEEHLTPDQVRSRALLTFQREARCGVIEARYYLESHNYYFRDAFLEWKADREWELENYSHRTPAAAAGSENV